MNVRSPQTDLELAIDVLPVELYLRHWQNDLPHIEQRAKDAVKELAAASPEDFPRLARKALVLLSLYDHLTDRRTVGMIGDYINF